MRKVLSVLVCILLTMPAFATGDATPTSKGYVDAQMATLQDNLPGAVANTVVTTTATAGETGTKAIYDSTGNYVTQQDALVTAEDANTAIQMAIQGELVCREYDPTGQYCYVYDVRPAIQSLLPAGYTELEYLESTGTQYIDTGLTVKADTLAEFQYQFTDNNANYVFGQIAGRAGCLLGYRSIEGIWWHSHRNENAEATTGTISLLKHRVVFSADGNVYRDNNAIAIRGDFTCTHTETMLMFGERNDPHGAADDGIYKGRVKIWYFVFKEGTNIVRNFIPARRDSDGELGMYDTVSGTFFTNAGTGNFIAGPDLNVYLPSGN